MQNYILLIFFFLLNAIMAFASEPPIEEVEAINLIRAALASQTYRNPSEELSCQISSVWAKNSVSQEVAQEVFGESLRADLVPPEPVPNSHDILTSAVYNIGQLCPEVKSQQALTSYIEGKRPFRHEWTFTYPVFNASFSRCIVIWTDMYSKTGVSFTQTALIFGKRGGKWNLLKSEVIGQT